MDALTVSGSHVAPVAAQGRAIWRCTIAAYLACQAGAFQPVLAQEAASGGSGYYVLDLEPGSVPAREDCKTIGISALGGARPRAVRLVARSTDGSELLAGHSRPAYETIKEVPAEVVHSGRARVCFNDVQMFIRISADGMPAVMEVALFPLDVPTPVGRDWSRPDYDSIRLSDWTAVLVPGWLPARRSPVASRLLK